MRQFWNLFVDLIDPNPDNGNSVWITDLDTHNDYNRCCHSKLVKRLAHTWHDQHVIDGLENEVIKSIYQVAKDSGAHASVLSVFAGNEPTQSFAIANELEYFAVLSQEYWYMSRQHLSFIRIDTPTTSTEAAWYRPDTFLPVSTASNDQILAREKQLTRALTAIH